MVTTSHLTPPPSPPLTKSSTRVILKQFYKLLWHILSFQRKNKTIPREGRKWLSIYRWKRNYPHRNFFSWCITQHVTHKRYSPHTEKRSKVTHQSGGALYQAVHQNISCCLYHHGNLMLIWPKRTRWWYGIEWPRALVGISMAAACCPIMWRAGAHCKPLGVTPRTLPRPAPFSSALEWQWTLTLSLASARPIYIITWFWKRDYCRHSCRLF